MRNPRIPMIPEALPHQGTYIPVSLPRRPEPFEVAIDLGGRDLPMEARLKTTPRRAGYLFQAEWAWSPDHNRLSGYYLHRGRRYWSLFCRRFDDNWERWEWTQIACVPLAQASERQAAFWLVVEVFKVERGFDIEEWHWIAETGVLDVADLRAIGHEVWSR